MKHFNPVVLRLSLW